MIASVGNLLAVFSLIGIAAVPILRRHIVKQRVLEQLRIGRITPEELKRKLDAKEHIAILDLRHPLDFLPQPYTIPGAIRIPVEQLEARHQEIPRDRELILYCTCPNEASSAMTAVKLRRYGFKQVRLLEGGFHAWMERGFPVKSEFGLPVPLEKLHRAGLKATIG